jgi:uncharacterized protein YhhL (DUF1145 family)
MMGKLKILHFWHFVFVDLEAEYSMHFHTKLCLSPDVIKTLTVKENFSLAMLNTTIKKKFRDVPIFPVYITIISSC